MKIHQIRNATMIIETAGKVLLVDPMLGSKGNLPHPIQVQAPEKSDGPSAQ